MSNDSSPSPLTEANPASLDVLFERINAKLVAGVPETISDADLMPVVERLRQERVRFLANEAAGKRANAGAPRKRTPKSIAEAMNIATAADLDGI